MKVRSQSLDADESIACSRDDTSEPRRVLRPERCLSAATRSCIAGRRITAAPRMWPCVTKAGGGVWTRCGGRGIIESVVPKIKGDVGAVKSRLVPANLQSLQLENRMSQGINRIRCAEVDAPETAASLHVCLCDVVVPLLHECAAALQHVGAGVGTLDAAHGMAQRHLREIPRHAGV